MNTVLMPIVVVKDGDLVLLRKMDPVSSPYNELWGLFGGRIEDGSSVNETLNKELMTRWNFTVSITLKLWWDEETKPDHDGEEKLFIYLDVLCSVKDGKPYANNQNEKLEWVPVSELNKFDINPPTKVLLKRLGYLH